MPNPLVAHRSSAHRLACLSLYRALLKQSAAVSSIQANGLKPLIRHRFKTDRLLQSPSQIANGLDAGHEGLDLLRASTRGERDSVARLSSLLEKTFKIADAKANHYSALRSSRVHKSPPRLGRKAGHTRSSANQSLQSRQPDSRSIFERPIPLSDIKSGRRRVPNFMAVQGIPLLRYSKPQPVSLGRVLRQKIAWQTKKWDQRSKLTEEMIPLGETEDAWDGVIARQGRQEGLTNEKLNCRHEADVDDVSSDAESWQSASRAADLSIMQKIKDAERRNLEASRRMVNVLKQERLLAAQEQAESKATKYQGRAMRGVDDFLGTGPGRSWPSRKEMTKGI